MVFSDADIRLFHHPYFSLIRITDTECELKSINSGHYWKIILRSSYCDLEHKHEIHNPYHHQTAFGFVELALLEIVNHDDYVCRRQKKSNIYHNFFEYIVDYYKEESVGNI